MENCAVKNTSTLLKRIVTLSIFAAVLSLFMGGYAFSAFTLRGTVIAVDGFRLTIALDPREPVLPAVGDKVDIIKTVGEGRIELDIGDWQVTAVDGRIVRAEPIMAMGVDPPQVNMKAEIHLFTGSAPAGESPKPTQGQHLTNHDAFTASRRENKPLLTARGKVIMTRGDVITVRIDEKDWPADEGDAVKVSYTVDGEAIQVGTWRISAVKEGGTVDALPFEIKGQPNIGMDALVYSRSGRPGTGKEPAPAQKEKEPASIEKGAGKRSIEDALASYSRTTVPVNVGGLGKSVRCESGTIEFHADKIEMTAKGGKNYECCTVKLSDELLSDFYATVKVRVDTTSHKDYIAGIMYGNKTGDVIKTDSIIGVTAFKYGLESWVNVYRRTAEGKPWNHILGTKTSGDYGKTDPDPAPGTLALVKTGRTCRIFWNGEEMGTWEEPIISHDHLWLVFSPVVKGKTTATFEDIHIYRLR